MAGHLTATGGGGGVNFATTSIFFPIGTFAGQGQSATEANVSWITRTAGTWSKLQCYITGNGSASVVVRFRVNNANGNQLLSIGTTANTYFEDTSNSDTVAAGDTIAMIYTAANTGTVTYSGGASLFTPSGSEYVARVGCITAGTSFTTAATDFLQAWCDTLATTQTDATSKTVVESSCTAKNLYANVSTNARTTTTNMRLWKNNAAGNLIIPYTSGQTGIKEDTSNTDSLSAGDTINGAVSTAAADSASLVLFNLYVDLTSTTGSIPYIHAVFGNVNANLTRYYPVTGRGTAGVTVEAERQLKAESAGTFEKSSVTVSANTVTATSNLRMRVNGNPGNNVRAIGASTTGTITDLSNTDTVVASDLVATQLTTGATGTTLTARQACITFTVASANAVKDIIQMGIVPFAR